MIKPVLAIKTDQPMAELYLLDQAGQPLAQKIWKADRQLTASLFDMVEALLKSASSQLTDLGGVVVFVGPGSFTGLRIGVTFANTLAYSLAIPVVGAAGRRWLQAIGQVAQTPVGQYAMPAYGAAPRISKPRK